MPLPDVEPGTDVDADVLHADDTGAYVAVGAFRHDRLYRVDMGGAVTLLAEPDVELTDIDSGPDGTIWLAGNGDTFFRLDDEGLTTLDAAPVGQGVQVDDGVLRLATRSVLDGTQLVESTDRGETFTTSFHLSELQAPPRCPEDSPVAIRCDTLWPALEARLPLGEGEEPGGGVDPADTGDAPHATPDTTKPAAQSRCGGGGAFFLLVPLLLLPTRRRR